MGGTLPAAARAVTRAGDARRQDTATLYAFNTLGAVAGCLVATFFLLEIYGTRATLWLAAALNILVAVVARALDQTGRSGRNGRSRLGLVSSPSCLSCPSRPGRTPRLAGLPAHCVGHSRVRVLSDGARLVPAAGAAARRIGLHLRAGAGDRARRDRHRRAALLAGLERAAGHARRIRGHLPARSGRRGADLCARRSRRVAGAGAPAARRRRVRHDDRLLVAGDVDRRAAAGDRRRLSVPAADRALRPRPRAASAATSAWPMRPTPRAQSSVRWPADSASCRGCRRQAPGGSSRWCSLALGVAAAVLDHLERKATGCAVFAFPGGPVARRAHPPAAHCRRPDGDLAPQRHRRRARAAGHPGVAQPAPRVAADLAPRHRVGRRRRRKQHRPGRRRSRLHLHRQRQGRRQRAWSTPAPR